MTAEHAQDKAVFVARKRSFRTYVNGNAVRFDNGVAIVHDRRLADSLRAHRGFGTLFVERAVGDLPDDTDVTSVLPGDVNAGQAASDDSSVGAHPIAQLDLDEDVAALLTSAGIATVGDLSSAMAAETQWFRDMPGIGEAKATAIEMALEKYESEHPAPEDPHNEL